MGCGDMVIELYNETYDVGVHVVIGGKYKAAQKEFKSKFVTPGKMCRSDCYGCVEGRGRGVLVWFADYPTPALLAHEILHLVHYILSLHEMELSDNTEEAYACLQEWCMWKLWGEIYGEWKSPEGMANPA